MISRVKIDLLLPGLKAPLRVDFMSDMHIRNRGDLDRFIEATREPGAETLLLAGDYVEKRRFLKPLFDHLLRTYERVIAVYGNNDLAAHVRLSAIGRSPRIRFLFDEIADLDGIHILGTRDPARDKPVVPVLPEGPLLVLSHSPDIALKLPPDRELLILSGHVHGGQFRIPGVGWWWSHTKIGHRYGEGHVRRGKHEIFVGRGIGYSMLPLRNVPQEIYTLALHGGAKPVECFP